MNDQTKPEPQGVVDPAKWVSEESKPTRGPAGRGVRTSGSGRLSASIAPLLHRALNMAALARGMESRDLLSEALALHPDIAVELERLEARERQAAEDATPTTSGRKPKPIAK